MAAYLFTNKFKIGDEVECIRGNPRYPTAYIQKGDSGVVIEIWGKGYVVRKSQDAKLSLGKLIEKRKEECFMHECEIDFADPNKRQPVKIKVVRIRRFTPPKDLKAARLKLLKKRGKIFLKKQKTQQPIDMELEAILGEDKSEEL